MPRTSKTDAPISLDEPVVEGRDTTLQLGDYTVAFETHKADMDPAPLFRGLPGDRCPCPHWVIVLAGQVSFRYADHDEVFKAGMLDGTPAQPGPPAADLRGNLSGRVQSHGRHHRDDGGHREEPRSGGRRGRPGGRCLTWTVPDMDVAIVRELSEKLIRFLETGDVPEGLFRPDVFLDLTMPTWRVQAASAEDLIAERKQGHPGPGRVTRWRADPTPSGFVLEFEERWNSEGQQWYAREMMRIEVTEGTIAEVTVYCTGDWDQARQAEHAAAVSARLAGSAGGGVAVLIPLVARAGVLAEAGSALTAARAGRGALLTITGEPGIGKTRLAEEAAERAEGFEVVWTWGAAAGGAALGPWSRVLRVLAGGHAAVARLIADSPFLAGLTDPARAGGGRDPGGARSQLSFDLAEVIAAAAAARPVLVVFDDAHQADTSSLRLLTELAPALRTMPAAVLVTARDGDRDWHGRLDMRTALLRSGDVISLQPLAEGDVAAVVAGVTGAPAGPDLVGVIASAARETRSW